MADRESLTWHLPPALTQREVSQDPAETPEDDSDEGILSAARIGIMCVIASRVRILMEVHGLPDTAFPPYQVYLAGMRSVAKLHPQDSLHVDFSAEMMPSAQPDAPVGAQDFVVSFTVSPVRDHAESKAFGAESRFTYSWRPTADSHALFHDPATPDLELGA